MSHGRLLLEFAAAALFIFISFKVAVWYWEPKQLPASAPSVRE
jgi:hypothetical protein